MLLQVPNIKTAARTFGGQTPLICAVQSGNIYVVAECLNKHFNPFDCDGLMLGPIDYAKQFQNVEGNNLAQLIEKAQV